MQVKEAKNHVRAHLIVKLSPGIFQVSVMQNIVNESHVWLICEVLEK